MSQAGTVTAPKGSPAAPIASLILLWYDRHARELPWRIPPARGLAGETADPYRVWLSEIMLQQTTVAVVRERYALFLSRWPSIEALAAAPDGEVMAAWAGLGYYARARNLLACARAVAASPDRSFPRTAAGLRALPGVGDYTSAAVAAIAFGERVAVVDGNVERVTTRLFALGEPLPAARPAIRRLVDAMTPVERPGDFAQAMMDLGATVCTPRKPACILCPLAGPCEARAAGTQDAFPVKVAKAPRPARIGAVFVAFRQGDGAVLLRRRPPGGMLGAMAEAPSTGWSARRDGATGEDAAPFPADWQPAGEVRHGFTHFELTLEVWAAMVHHAPTAELEAWWAPADGLAEEALPTLMRKAIALAAARR